MVVTKLFISLVLSGMGLLFGALIGVELLVRWLV